MTMANDRNNGVSEMIAEREIPMTILLNSNDNSNNNM